MKPKKRQKLCHHCEGEVDLDVIVCPFCAADLREEKKPTESYSYRSTKDLEEGLSNPSFSFKSAIQEKVEKKGLEESSLEEVKNRDWLSIVLVTTGFQLLLFGFLTLLFSQNGMIRISWNASYWFLYLLLGAPFFYFGYKNLS